MLVLGGRPPLLARASTKLRRASFYREDELSEKRLDYVSLTRGTRGSCFDEFYDRTLSGTAKGVRKSWGWVDGAGQFFVRTNVLGPVWPVCVSGP